MWTFVANHKSIDAYISVYELINQHKNYASSTRFDNTMNILVQLSPRKNDSSNISEKEISKRLTIFYSIYYLVLYTIASSCYVMYLFTDGMFYK